MKLRNKKTGEHGYYQVISAGNLIRVRDCDSEDTWQYDSLAAFCEKWEDYTPKEPLIKDEKVRKAVRAWAEANDVDRVWHECATCWLRGNGLVISFDGLELEQGNYTITELCGEEEEPEDDEDEEDLRAEEY